MKLALNKNVRKIVRWIEAWKSIKNVSLLWSTHGIHMHDRILDIVILWQEKSIDLVNPSLSVLNELNALLNELSKDLSHTSTNNNIKRSKVEDALSEMGFLKPLVSFLWKIIGTYRIFREEWKIILSIGNKIKQESQENQTMAILLQSFLLSMIRTFKKEQEHYSGEQKDITDEIIATCRRLILRLQSFKKTEAQSQTLL